MKHFAALARRWALVLVAAGATAALPAVADPVADAIHERIDFVRETGQLTLDGSTLVSRAGLNQLYGSLGFQPLWREPGRVEELLELVRESVDDGLNPADYHLGALESLWREVRIRPTPESLADLDVLASDAYMLLLYHLYFGKVDPLSLEPTWNFSTREVTGEQATEYVVRAITGGRLKEAAAAVRPAHWMYDHGRRALRAYRQIEAQGGWPQVPDGPTLKPGMTDPRVAALRRRLAVTGDLMDQPLDGELYDEALEAAVRSFQARHLLTADGAVGRGTLRELNVPVGDRIRQIRVNLERARHVLHEIGDEPMVAVDIAGFEVRWIEGRKVVWSSRVVVGQPMRQTPTFKAQIEYIVLNPTWTVPPGILQKDVFPGIRRDPRYLEKKGLEVFDRNGRRIDAGSIDWSRYTARNFPYFLRQASGDDNALGRVKIMFPNPHLVYLHDTPARSLFEKDDRTFSSGCIRVEKPFELAERLLAGTAWTREAMDAAVATGETRTVRLPKPVPVLLIYWTVDEDLQGRIVFKRDPYDRDPPLAAALDQPFRFGSRPPT
ncbi:MAG: L,D-transpeptidase family protein [Steroidobacteraceae bacterium]|jgi:murein L,D-transpeptidase YcbB/YkuD|nr:L,D-transpeptidase family protein [Steroidobacteraceae bacterium]